MSDTIYRIIPKNPDFSLPNSYIKQLVTLLERSIVSYDEVSWQKFENPTFIDCGGNFTFVSCPSCNEVIPDEIWGDMMTKCYEDSHFNSLETTTPCCNFPTTLNDLNYDWDCSFARFTIEILNPKKPIEWNEKGLVGLEELRNYRVIVARI